ncbi:hypothetical protein LXL04_006359 [Taraxacum kok-saghyz]
MIYIPENNNSDKKLELYGRVVLITWSVMEKSMEPVDGIAAKTCGSPNLIESTASNPLKQIARSGKVKQSPPPSPLSNCHVCPPPIIPPPPPPVAY